MARMNTDLSTATRLGKIARLPFRIRQELNERLEDNEPSQRLVEWLNSLPSVRDVLEALFESRPISERLDSGIK